MKKQTYAFNVNYLDDIYGAEAVCSGSTYFCRKVKYHVGQVFQPKIKKALEKELIFNTVFCQRFLAGEVVVLKIKSEEVVKCQMNR